MIDFASKLLLFFKDFTGRGADCFYWLENDRLEQTSAADAVAFPGAVVCHDFWMIRDVLYDKTGDLPATVIDVDEFRIPISGNPDDRLNRAKLDITTELAPFAASKETCSAYKLMINNTEQPSGGKACVRTV